ncbi:MAG: hypothetical protein V3S30_10625, partial [Thermoanaerobaculia bacterium]
EFYRRKAVAIFGGGLKQDPGSDKNPIPGSVATADLPTYIDTTTQGHWLYMVDMETGEAIYKRRLLGAAPSEPAAVDTDQSGYINRIYIPTTGGLIYRVDLDIPGDLPGLEDLPVLDVNGFDHTVQRIIDSNWEPYPIFDTLAPVGPAGAGVDARRPIYHRPSVLFVAKLGQYAISFGTGDREDLFSNDSVLQHFYVVVDDTEWLGGMSTLPTPISPTGLANFSADESFLTTFDDFLLTRPEGQRGWFIELEPKERVITDAFALSGVSFFSSFQPLIEIDGLGDGADVCEELPGEGCSASGSSNVFVVNTTNGNGFLTDESGDMTRFKTVSAFITNPFTEPGQNKNVDTTGGGTGGGTATSTADDLTDELRAVMETLKGLFPEACRFAEYRVDIKALAADTTLQFIAPIPTCVVMKNWREY